MSLCTLGKKVPILIKVTKDVASFNLLRFNYTMATQFNVCRCITLPVIKSRWKNTTRRDDGIRIYSTKSADEKVFYDSAKIVLDKEMLPIVEKKIQDKKIAPNVRTWKRFIDAADPYMKLARVDKPIGTWLLFWPCSWSISLAAIQDGIPPDVVLKNMALFLTGSFIMRGAGCTINDLWDKDIDRQVERTKCRPLVSGAVSEKQAVCLLAAQLSAGLAVLLQLNWYSVALGASSMVLVVVYPLAKRFTDYPQLVLGATFNWGALLGYSATAGSVQPAICLPLYVSAMFWSVVYDTIYAHQDKDDDARIGMKSTALTFGRHTKPLLCLLSAGMVGGAGAAGLAAQLEWPYYAALGAVAAHLAGQIYTLQPDDATDCARKFKSNSLVGLIVLMGIVCGGWRQYWSKVNKTGAEAAPETRASV